MPQKKLDKKSAADYEKLGRMIESAYLTGALDKKRLVFNSFIKGVSVGAGSVIGATVIIAILLWILSLLNEVPFIGPIFEALERTIQN